LLARKIFASKSNRFGVFQLQLTFFLGIIFSQIIKNVEYTVQLQAGTERGKREENNIFTFE
jgi:hypothetical protein